MTYRDFHHALRILLCLSGEEFLSCVNAEDREFIGDDKLLERFRQNEFKTFLELPTQDSERLFALIERKNAAYAARSGQ